ncbi:hypothetical protein PENSPDRAFT_661470 [Peniophora sp. CONT]|nr:hypothetical protein PENSPDRAFT_661470 [Peniophora sp. CONT]
MPRTPRGRKPSQPQVLKKVEQYAKPVRPELFSIWRISCANHGHLLKDVHLQYLKCDSNLGRYYVVCDIDHDHDTFGKGKGVRFVSDELPLEERRECILYRDGLKLEMDQPTPLRVKKASQASQPGTRKGKNGKSQGSRSANVSTLKAKAAGLTEAVNPSYTTAAATTQRGSAQAPISIDSSRSASPVVPATPHALIIESPRAQSLSDLHDEGFESHDYQCVWFYQEDNKVPDPVWLPWRSNEGPISLAEYREEWQRYELKPSDKVKVLAAPHSRRGVATWKTVILGEVVLLRRLPGMVITRPGVKEFCDLQDNAKFAFKGALPVLNEPKDVIEL